MNLFYRCGRDYCDAQEIMEIADAMESNGMRDAGYTDINLDGEYSISIPKLSISIAIIVYRYNML